jgi:hypothetical protein
MRAATAASYFQSSEDTLTIDWIKLSGSVVPIDSDFPPSGTSILEVSWRIDTKTLLAESHLKSNSKISLILEGICDHLKIRETIKTWEIELSEDSFFVEETVGLIHNVLLNNGLELEFVICVVDPHAEKNHPLACDFEGGVLTRTLRSVSRRGESNLLPIEFIEFDEAEDPIWAIELDLEDGLDAPASSALRVQISSTSHLANGLKAQPESFECLVAFDTLKHAIQSESLIKIFENEEAIRLLQEAANNFHNLEEGHWAKDTKTIGFQLNSWMRRYCVGKDYLDVAEQFKSDRLNSLVEMRKKFMRNSQ